MVTIVWVGHAHDHLYAVLSDGKTYRLDRVDPRSSYGPESKRVWTLVAELPL